MSRTNGPGVCHVHRRRPITMSRGIRDYQDPYRLCWSAAPEGIIIELAEQIG